ncbi:MAG: hypothetical protein ACOX2A_08905 [Tepidanaerobacteraceae bacterium]
MGTKQEISEGYTVSDKDLSHLTGAKGKAVTLTKTRRRRYDKRKKV